MPGLYKTIALFVIAAAALAYANGADVADRYPAIDTMFWFCVLASGTLAIRALVEVVRNDRDRGEQDHGRDGR